MNAKEAYRLRIASDPHIAGDGVYFTVNWIEDDEYRSSLAPGSRVVTEYLEKSGLQEYLNRLGFYLAGYGCTTCIGNSGPLDPGIEKAITENKLSVAAVLSGNRNFEARIHKDVRANYLMSPPLVVAFALAGTVIIDMEKEPLGKGKDGKDVFLKDIWPTTKEINDVIAKSLGRSMFKEKYSNIDNYNSKWAAMDVSGSKTYQWDEKSTYIRNPTFFEEFKPDTKNTLKTIKDAYPLLILGDSVTTDHISPAGSISKNSPAGKYLIEKGVKPEDFNSFGSRRGNHEVMMRGTYGNNRLRNQLASQEGGYTVHLPDRKEGFIFDTAQQYSLEKTPLIVFAGKEYGAGSSRDWAAKGTYLLGIKAVIAESYERIHRSNLVGMGVIPLEFQQGRSFKSLSADVTKRMSIEFTSSNAKSAVLRYINTEGKESTEKLKVRIDNEAEMLYFSRGGILQNALSNIINAGKAE